MASGTILIVDDDESIRKVLGYILHEAGYTVSAVASAREAIRHVEREHPDIVLSDVKMPRMDGITLLKEIKHRDDSIAVVMLTAFGTVETAVEAMKAGAADYLTKPISRDELTLTLKKILRLRRLEQENIALRASLRDKFQFDNIVGLSVAMQSVFDAVEKVAPTDATVLITGESGTGKELIAKAIHFNSPRAARKLIPINCAAIPSELLESELFGHVKGAFTGAIRDKEGKFQAADNGTLFLDEVGSMPHVLQAKLLRALQEREIERVGDTTPTAVDVRIIAATNRPLVQLIHEGEFREDLYYRLNVVPIVLPPLRDRPSDIGLLVEHFVAKYASGRGVSFTDDAIRAMQHYDWPGNVRELENFCERTILMTRKNRIGATIVKEQLDTMMLERDRMRPTDRLSLPDMEKRAVIDALVRSGWNQSQAARLLGIPRHVLLYRMKKFDIQADKPR